MAMSSILPSISRMHAGDHYCGIFRTDEDHHALIVDFIRDGIARNERMLYIVNVQTASQLRELLVSAGIAFDELVEKGQLLVLTARDAYLRGGEFDPDKMIGLVSEATDQALAAGFTALRATGEMTWALSGEPGSERLVEYESKLNRFFPSKKCYAICQYDRRRFDSEMLLEILQTHPQVLFGKEGYDNSGMYFVPADEFLAPDRESAILNRWLRNLMHKPAGE